MNKFISKLCIFLLPILGFLVLGEIALRITPNDYSYKNQYLLDKAQEIEVLIMGSSHAFYGINPEYISENAFNAAHISQSIDYDYLIFSKFSENLGRLKTLVLSISYHTLYSRLSEGVENWRIPNYTVFYDIEENSTLRNNLLLYGKKPSTIFKKSLNIGRNNDISVSDSGFGLGYTNVKQANLVVSGKSAAKRHTKNVDRWAEKNTEVLRKFISDCKELGVNVLLITTPTLSEYRVNLDEKQLSGMNSILSSLSENYSNVEYLSFISDNRFLAEDFHDADHLNGLGAEKFSRILNALLEKNEMKYAKKIE